MADRNALIALRNAVFQNNGASPHGTGTGGKLRPTDLWVFFEALIEAATESGALNFEPWDPTRIYGAPSYVSHNNNTWQYIALTPSSGVIPGTNGQVWKLTSAGQLSHLQNTDRGSMQTSFFIQYQSQNQDPDGITLFGLNGGQGGGTDVGLRNLWDAQAQTRQWQICQNYTASLSDIWLNLEGFTPISENEYGTHPAFTSQAELNAYLLGGTYTPPPAAPAAPTNGIVDDVNNTFDFTLAQY